MPYLVVALKRVYPESADLTLLKTGALTFLLISLNAFANFVAIRLTLAVA